MKLIQYKKNKLEIVWRQKYNNNHFQKKKAMHLYEREVKARKRGFSQKQKFKKKNEKNN